MPSPARPQCGAATKSADRHPCTHTAGEGTEHLGFGNCKLHGGNTPGGKKHAQKLAAQAAVVTYGLPREIDPVDALLEEIYRTAGAIDFIAAQIQELDPQGVVWGVAETVESQGFDAKGVRQDGSSITEKAAINVWVELYHRERKHYADVCKAAIAANIEERRTKLAEEQGILAGQWLRAILAGLGLTAEQRKKVPGLVRANLALVQSDVA